MGYLHVSLTSELFVKGIALKKHLKNGSQNKNIWEALRYNIGLRQESPNYDRQKRFYQYWKNNTFTKILWIW